MSARLLVCTFALGLVLVSACGGAADSGLFGGATDSGTNDGSTSESGTPKDSAAGDAKPADLVQCVGTPGCKVGTEACCRKANGPVFTYACAPLGTCKQGGGDSLEIPCDKTRDCELLGAPGDVCCVTSAVAPPGGAAEVVCRPPAECTAADGRTSLCDPQAATPCPNTNLHCQLSSMTIPGYNICR